MILIYNDELLNNKGLCDMIFTNDTKTNHLNKYEIFFDLLDEASLIVLNQIYDYSFSIGLNRITTESWLGFLFNNNIKLVPIQTNVGKLNTNNINHIEYKHKGRKYDITLNKENIYNDDIIYNDYYPKVIDILKNDSTLSTEQINDAEKLINKLKTLEIAPSLFETKTIKCNNYTELLLAFLHCLLSSNKNYCIKKCKHCEKYFVATKSDTKYCKRKYLIDKNNISCDSIVNHFKQSYDYKIFMKYNVANSKYFSNNAYPEDYIENYKKEKDIKLDEAIRARDLSTAIDFVKNYRKSSTDNSPLS